MPWLPSAQPPVVAIGTPAFIPGLGERLVDVEDGLQKICQLPVEFVFIKGEVFHGRFLPGRSHFNDGGISLRGSPVYVQQGRCHLQGLFPAHDESIKECLEYMGRPGFIGLEELGDVVVGLGGASGFVVYNAQDDPFAVHAVYGAAYAYG